MHHNIKLSNRTYQKPCVWIKVAELVQEYLPVDLGIGKPDVKTASFIKQSLIETQSLPDSINQYTNSRGHPNLVNILSQFYSPLMKRKINPSKEICTTNGADGSIFCSIMALINPGDEVIVFQPFYDSYVTAVAIAQGVPVFVNLKINDCTSTAHVTFDRTELIKAFTPKTKAIIVNSPHNPTGKVFNREEMQFIADLCIKYNVICICDYVYEHYTYNSSEHIYMNTLKNMWERTITIASAGKAFNVTGWKLGWSIGPEYLIDGIHIIHATCNYTSPSVIQEAIARCFEFQINRLNDEECYWNRIRNMLKKKRDIIVKAFHQAGLTCVIPEAGYFLIVDFEPLIKKHLIKKEMDKCEPLANQECYSNYLKEIDEYDTVKWLIKNKKLMGVPLGPFYDTNSSHKGKCFIRFCFFKKKKSINAAKNIIMSLNDM